MHPFHAMSHIGITNITCESHSWEAINKPHAKTLHICMESLQPCIKRDNAQ